MLFRFRVSLSNVGLAGYSTWQLYDRKQSSLVFRIRVLDLGYLVRVMPNFPHYSGVGGELGTSSLHHYEEACNRVRVIRVL